MYFIVMNTSIRVFENKNKICLYVYLLYLEDVFNANILACLKNISFFSYFKIKLSKFK
jgi:hypothetical protein